MVRPLILVKVQPVKLRFTHCSHCLRDKRCRHFLNCGCFKYWSFRLSKPAERLFSIKWDITSPDQHFEFDGHVYKDIHLALTCLSGYTLYPSDVKGREAGRQLGNPSLWIWLLKNQATQEVQIDTKGIRKILDEFESKTLTFKIRGQVFWQSCECGNLTTRPHRI